MINVNQITSQLARLPDAALQQYAAMHKNDPYTMSLALAESNRRKEMRAGAQGTNQQQQPTVADQTIAEMGQQAAPMPQQEQSPLPEEQGIGALPTPNMQNMADGGIVGYAVGGTPKPDALEQYVPEIIAEARRQGVDPALALRLFKTESAGQKGAVSHKGASGLGQLMAAAAEEMGISKEDRFIPSKNIQASIGYLKKQLDRFKDPAKAVAAYNWGPGNVAKHLAKNEGQLNPVGLPKETAKYITKLLPMGEARAGELPPKAGLATLPAAANAPVAAPRPAPAAAPVIPGSQMQDIPGSIPQPARAPEEPWYHAAGRRLLGAPEAAASLVTGAVAPFTGAVQSGISQLTPHPMTMEQGMEQSTYTPRSEAGRSTLEDTLKTMEALKIPPYLAHMNVPSRGVGAAAQAAKAAELAKAAEAAASKVENVRLAPPTKPVPAGVAPEAAALGEQARTQRAKIALEADKRAAAEAARKAGVAETEAVGGKTLEQVMAERAIASRGEQARLGAVGRAGTYGGMGSPVEPAVSDTYADEMLRGIKPGAGETTVPTFESGVTPPAIEASAPAEEKKTFGLSNDDLLMLGLNMMAGKSQHALQNVGEAGLATLVGRREREKTAAEKEKAASEAELRKAQTGYYGAQSEYLTEQKSENAKRLEAAKLIESEMGKYKAGMAGMAATPEQEAAYRAAITQNVFANLGLSPNGRMAGTSADVEALIARNIPKQ